MPIPIGPRPWTIARLRVRASARPAPRCYSAVMRVVGIDLGERRIGVAVSDASGTLARPLRTIERGASDTDAIERLHGLIAELAAEDESAPLSSAVPTRLDGFAYAPDAARRTMSTLLSARLTVRSSRATSVCRVTKPRSVCQSRKGLAKAQGELDAAARRHLQDYLDARASSGHITPSQEEDE